MKKIGLKRLQLVLHDSTETSAWCLSLHVKVFFFFFFCIEFFLDTTRRTFTTCWYFKRSFSWRFSLNWKNKKSVKKKKNQFLWQIWVRQAFGCLKVEIKSLMIKSPTVLKSVISIFSYKVHKTQNPSYHNARL